MVRAEEHEESPRIGFDEIAGTVQEYFYIYRLKLKERLDDETFKFVVEKSVYWNYNT